MLSRSYLNPKKMIEDIEMVLEKQPLHSAQFADRHPACQGGVVGASDFG
jgi:hypothetical protein